MAVVEAFDLGLDGVNLKFMANDHLEPHFHAISRKEGWNYRVFILADRDEMFEAKRPKGAGIMPDPPRKDLERLVPIHRAALLEQWGRDVQLQPGLMNPERTV